MVKKQHKQRGKYWYCYKHQCKYCYNADVNIAVNISENMCINMCVNICEDMCKGIV